MEAVKALQETRAHQVGGSRQAVRWKGNLTIAFEIGWRPRMASVFELESAWLQRLYCSRGLSSSANMKNQNMTWWLGVASAHQFLSLGIDLRDYVIERTLRQPLQMFVIE